MKIAVHRILFGVAAFFILVSTIQSYLLLNSFEIPIAGLEAVGFFVSFLQIILLMLPVFLFKVRMIGLLILPVFFLSEFLYILIRFFTYVSYETPDWALIRGWILPMFMIPSFDLSLITTDPLIRSYQYTRFIGAIIAIVATILSLKARKVSEPLQVHGTPEMRQPQLFVPGATPKKVTGAGTTTESIEQVERLGALLSKGLITKDEFEIKKKEILGL